MDSIIQEMRKVLMAGLGLVDLSFEKAQQAVEHLAKRGEITAEQAKQLSAELAKKLKNKVNECGVCDMFTEKGKQQSVIRDLEDMTDGARQAVRDALDDMIARTKRQKEEQAEKPESDFAQEAHDGAEKPAESAQADDRSPEA